MTVDMAGTRADTDEDVQLVLAHLDYLRYLGRRPGTIDQRRKCLARLIAALPVALLDATKAELEPFVMRTDIGAEARNTTLSHLRGFYRWAVRCELVEADPTSAIERPRRPRRFPRPIPEVELGRALAAADEPIRSWLYLAAFAGLRCCEIAPLRGEDRHGDVLVIREQKGGDEGAVPIAPALAEAIDWLPAHGWWFRRMNGGGPITAAQLQHRANTFLHDIGLERTMHTLRHRFVTAVYEASGRDLVLTQQLARHRSIASTVGYTAIDPDRGGGTVARLSVPA